MKIGITGDTHGNLECIRKIVELAPQNIEQWLHTGDHAEDADELADLTGLPVARVLGNCDYDYDQAKIDVYLTLAGYKIWLTHGHRYIGRAPAAELGWWAGQVEADIVVYGHTHVPMCDYYGDKLIINPGSPSRPRGGSKPCFAVLTLEAGQKPKVEFRELPVREKRYWGSF